MRQSACLDDDSLICDRSDEGGIDMCSGLIRHASIGMSNNIYIICICSICIYIHPSVYVQIYMCMYDNVRLRI